MKPHERENRRYTDGYRCNIGLDEKTLFKFLKEYIPAQESVLDVGCGTGDIALEIQKRGYNIHGVDFSDAAIDIASKAGLDCKVADLDHGIPYDDNRFYCVWAGDIIEHVFDPIYLLKEIKRVLRPGGYLLATVPYDLRIKGRLRILFGISYQESIYRKMGTYKHHTFFSKRLFEYMLEKANLEINKLWVRHSLGNRAFIIKSTFLISLFGNTMIISARSK